MIFLVETLRRWRRRLWVALLVLVLAFLVGCAHDGASLDHVDAGEAMAICLAVVESTVLVVGLRAHASKPFRWLAPAKLPRLVGLDASTINSLARASPAVLQVFRD